MKYSLVIHVNGSNSKDCNVYLMSENSSGIEWRKLWMNRHSSGIEWRKNGMIQNIHFSASVDNVFPNISIGFVGVTISKVEKPDFTSGIVIYYENSISFDEEIVRPSIGSVTVFRGVESGGSSWFSDNLKPLAGIQKIHLDINETVKLVIESVKSKHFTKVSEIIDWLELLPQWVTIKVKDLDDLLEIGTDGVIDKLEN